MNRQTLDPDYVAFCRALEDDELEYGVQVQRGHRRLGWSLVLLGLAIVLLGAML